MPRIWQNKICAFVGWVHPASNGLKLSGSAEPGFNSYPFFAFWSPGCPYGRAGGPPSGPSRLLCLKFKNNKSREAWAVSTGKTTRGHGTGRGEREKRKGDRPVEEILSVNKRSPKRGGCIWEVYQRHNDCWLVFYFLFHFVSYIGQQLLRIKTMQSLRVWRWKFFVILERFFDLQG